MNVAFGEELVHYKGIVTQKATTQDPGGERRVYLSVHRFHATGDLFVLPDGSTEVSISDNIGSVRLVVHSAGDKKQFDYKPFGDTLWTSDGGVNREGFDGTIFDNESSLQMLGFRMYDNETGRFTTCDPLWAAFPAQSPYSYAYNSPLTWRDPSGLAPEKEKDREKLMVVMPGPGDPSEYYVHTEIDYSNPRYNCGLGAMQYASLAEQLFYAMMANGGGGGGRTGTASWAYNGSTTTTTITNSDGTTTTTTNTTYHFTTYIPTTNGTMIVPTDVQQSGIPTGETPESVMLAFVGGINDILAADPTYFDGLLGSDVSVNIMNSNEITFQGQGGYAGLHSGVKGTNKSVITLAGDVLTGHTAYPKYPNKDGGFSPHEPYMIIAHEFAHANHFALTGDNFFSYNWQLQELFAITNTNRIQSFYNDPQRKTWSSIRPIWGMFYKSTWWHYQIYGY